MHSINLTILGAELSFTSEADASRVEAARDLVEERFEKIKIHGRQLSRDRILTFLALGLADDLLQANLHNDELRTRINAVLEKIENLA